MSADTSQLLDRCRRAGIKLRAGENDRIKVKPVQALTPDLADEIRAHRAELFATLRRSVNRLTFWPWRIRQPDGATFEAYYTPEATQTEVEQQFPGAAIEALSDEREPRRAKPIEIAELRKLIALVYSADNEPDRAEATACALKDAESALVCYRDLARRCGLDRSAV